MKKFPMIDVLLKLFIALTIGLLEKVLICLYCCLPIGLFMLLMSLKSKTHKATALSTFTTEQSEFQLIFPNYILVIVEPKLLKKYVDKKKKDLAKFMETNKYLIIALVLTALLSCIAIVIKHFA